MLKDLKACWRNRVASYSWRCGFTGATVPRRGHPEVVLCSPPWPLSTHDAQCAFLLPHSCVFQAGPQGSVTLKPREWTSRVGLQFSSLCSALIRKSCVLLRAILLGGTIGHFVTALSAHSCLFWEAVLFDYVYCHPPAVKLLAFTLPKGRWHMEDLWVS